MQNRRELSVREVERYLTYTNACDKKDRFIAMVKKHGFARAYRMALAEAREYGVYGYDSVPEEKCKTAFFGIDLEITVERGLDKLSSGDYEIVCTSELGKGKFNTPGIKRLVRAVNKKFAYEKRVATRRANGA